MSPILIGLIFSILTNLLVFLIAFRFQIDKLTDVTYSVTFILLASFFWFTGEQSMHPYKLILFFMPVLWAVRLGTYLMYRIMKIGRDKRFDEMRQSFFRFGRFFLIQGISIWIVALAYIYGLSATAAASDAMLESPYFYVGIGLWAFGLITQTVADIQKFKFRMKPENTGKFMGEGLFSIVRFPNYSGEILVWTGIFVAVIPLLHGLEWWIIISPIWITFLLLFVSGIPFLERSNAKRYGDLAAFKRYKKNTKKLIPFVF